MDFAHKEKDRICGRYTHMPVTTKKVWQEVIGGISLFIIIGCVLAAGGMF